MNKFRRISRAAFEAMYLDTTIPIPQIAEAFGLAQRTVCRRAKSYGLPVRSKATKRPHIADGTAFAELWLAGIDASEIAARFGVHYRTVANTAERLGLPKRRHGQRAPISLDDYQMRKALAASARETQAALMLSEMVDGRRTGGCGRRAA